MTRTTSGSDPRQRTDAAPAPSTLGLIRQLRLVWRLLRDARVSEWVKMIPVAALVYLVSPIDVIPDLVLPGLGQLDDLAIVLVFLKLFVELSPRAVVREHIERLLDRRGKPDLDSSGANQPYIDVPYRIVDQDNE